MMLLTPLVPNLIPRMKFARFALNEDVCFTVPWHLTASFSGVYGHSRCWLAGYGGQCNRMMIEASVNMNQECCPAWDTEIIEEDEGKTLGRCFPFSAFPELLGPKDRPAIMESLITPRCLEHNGATEEKWLTDPSNMAKLAAVNPKDFKIEQWTTGLAAFYKRCTTDQPD